MNFNFCKLSNDPSLRDLVRCLELLARAGRPLHHIEQRKKRHVVKSCLGPMLNKAHVETSPSASLCELQMHNCL
jgi:hypothetical protein